MARQRSAVVAAAEIAPRIEAGLAQLAEARAYAEDTRRDVWDFAVEIKRLSALGLTPNDLRWLICKGYVEHAREVTRAGEQGRAFHPAGNLTFGRRSCFVLTAAGNALARRLSAGPDLTRALADHQQGPVGNNGDQSPLPEWDPDRRELRLVGKLVKRYRVPSPNQERILLAFQEENWRSVIDDPLPPRPRQNPKRRLHDTVRSLNRNQTNRLIRFMGNGTGQGIRWELIEPSVAAGRD